MFLWDRKPKFSWRLENWYNNSYLSLPSFLFFPQHHLFSTCKSLIETLTRIDSLREKRKEGERNHKKSEGRGEVVTEGNEEVIGMMMMIVVVKKEKDGEEEEKEENNNPEKRITMSEKTRRREKEKRSFLWRMK